MAINANTASRNQLMALSGISVELADAIMLRRPFTSIEGLISIPGIGPATLERLKGQGLIVESVEPRFRIPVPITADIGLGDIVKRVTSAVGLPPCDGCGQRAAAMNRLVGFSGHRRR